MNENGKWAGDYRCLIVSGVDVITDFIAQGITQQKSVIISLRCDKISVIPCHFIILHK